VRHPAAVALLLVAGVLSAGGCLRAEKHAISRVELAGGTADDNVLLGLGRDKVQALFREALEASGRFELLAPGTKLPPSRRAAALRLELPFTREASREGQDGTWAEVGATVTVERRVDGLASRYEVVALGEHPVGGQADRAAAMQAALHKALAQLAGSADLQLSALDKTDLALQRDLKSNAEPQREFALRVLSDRQHPAVTEVWISRLREGDPEQVRRAMGVLAELRSQRAVKPLIELTRGQQPGFVREVVFLLAQIGGEEAKAYLFTVAQGHDVPELRAAAQQALAELEARPTSLAPTEGATR
jgi:hypothetical protein